MCAKRGLVTGLSCVVASLARYQSLVNVILLALSVSRHYHMQSCLKECHPLLRNTCLGE